MKAAIEQKQNKSNTHNGPFIQRMDKKPVASKQALPFISSNHTHPIQTKLTIGQPGDKYEREADAVADRVMKMDQKPTPSIQRMEEDDELLQTKPLVHSITPLVQRQAMPELQTKCAACEEEEKIQRMEEPGLEEEEQLPVQTKAAGAPTTASPGLSSRLSQSKGGGSPLPERTRSGMEAAFGTDFSGVRVHTGQSAVQMNQELNAQAFTHGSDIYFNQGKYRPESGEGKRLMAHELTHVVQQGEKSFQNSKTIQRQSNKCHNRGSRKHASCSQQTSVLNELRNARIGLKNANSAIESIVPRINNIIRLENEKYGWKKETERRLKEYLKDKQTSPFWVILGGISSLATFGVAAYGVLKGFKELREGLKGLRKLSKENRVLEKYDSGFFKALQEEGLKEFNKKRGKMLSKGWEVTKSAYETYGKYKSISFKTPGDPTGNLIAQVTEMVNLLEPLKDNQIIDIKDQAKNASHWNNLGYTALINAQNSLFSIINDGKLPPEPWPEIDEYLKLIKSKSFKYMDKALEGEQLLKAYLTTGNRALQKGDPRRKLFDVVAKWIRYNDSKARSLVITGDQTRIVYDFGLGVRTFTAGDFGGGTHWRYTHPHSVLRVKAESYLLFIKDPAVFKILDPFVSEYTDYWAKKREAYLKKRGILNTRGFYEKKMRKKYPNAKIAEMTRETARSLVSLGIDFETEDYSVGFALKDEDDVYSEIWSSSYNIFNTWYKRPEFKKFWVKKLNRNYKYISHDECKVGPKCWVELPWKSRRQSYRYVPPPKCDSTHKIYCR